MEAITTRLSTVISSTPATETRTQASITIPFSRIRSQTSIRLAPWAPAQYGIVTRPQGASNQKSAGFGRPFDEERTGAGEIPIVGKVSGRSSQLEANLV